MAPKTFIQKVTVHGGDECNRLALFNKTYESEEVEVVSCKNNFCDETTVFMLHVLGPTSKVPVMRRLDVKGYDYDDDDDDEDEEDDYDDEDEEDDYDDEDDEEEPPKTRKSPRVSGVLTKDTSRGR